MSKKIKFKIGEQYEKHEFDLDWAETMFDNNLRYEIYSYIGSSKITIHDFEVKKTFLAYNCDFLAHIFFIIELEKYPDLIDKLRVENNKKVKSKIFNNCIFLSHTRSQNYFIIDSQIILYFK